MKAEHAAKLTQTAIETLVTALDAGKSDGLKAFLAAAARFRQYSFRNVMLIASQRPDATRVSGFRGWQKLGRFVKKGEKGIVIVAPMPFRKREDAADDADRDAGMRFRGVHVFDVTQTDGEPLPACTTVNGDPGALTDRLKVHITAAGILLDTAADLQGADGLSKGGRITLRTGLTPAEEFSVLVHELAHERLHQTPRRDADTPRPTKVVRETEAEAVAFIVSHAVGLETGTAASDYIQLYDGDRATLEASLERIQTTATEILDAILDEATAPE